LEHAPTVEQDRDVTQQPRLGEVVRHLQHGQSPLPLKGAHLAARARPPPGVERRERLVQQQHLRACRERTRQRDELTFATAQRVDAAAGERVDTEARRYRPRSAVVGRSVTDVRFDGEVREQVRMLVNHRQPTPLRRQLRHVGATESHRPDSGTHDSSNRLQQRRLPGASRSNDDAIAASWHAERHVREYE
jgi:hypothetical protein